MSTERHYNNIFGTAAAGSITFADGVTTTGTFASAPNLPTISGGDYAKVIVEPDTPNEEITYLTAFTAGATTGTFTRAQETTTGRAHAAVAWVHGPTAANAHIIVAGTNVTVSDDGMGNVTVSSSGGGGGGGSCVVVDEKVLSVAAASVTFSAIPGTYRNLEVTWSAASDAAGGSQNKLTFNGDTGANYDYEWGYGQTTTPNALTAAAASFVYAGYLTDQALSPAPSAGRLLIPGYARTTFWKAGTGTASYKNGTQAGVTALTFGCWWRNTAAVTSITFTAGSGNLIAGSVFTLYGYSGITNP